MNITKEQLTEAYNRVCLALPYVPHCEINVTGQGTEDVRTLVEAGIRTLSRFIALIESSGDKASGPAKKIKIAYYASVCPQCGWPTERTDVLVLDDEHAIDLSAPSPAPTIKKDLTVGPTPKEVEEAMGRVKSIISGWSFHTGFPSEEGLAALAVIKAVLRPRVVTRKWAKKLSTRINKIQFITCPNDATLDTVERTTDELGIEVSEGEMR